MATRPPILPVFCTANPSNMADLPQSLVESGYTANEPMPVEYYNRLANNVGEWVKFLDESSTTTALFQDTAISARLLSQGLWSWSLANRTLSWSASAYIAFPSAADANNTILAGSVTLNAGDCAYVQTNTPFATYGTTSSGSTTLTSVLYADQIQPGWVVTGAGIASGTTVSSIDSDGSTVHLSQAATASGTDISLVFAGSGTLTVQTAPMASLVLSANTAIIARATDSTVYIGVGSGQMRLHDGEQKGLLENGYGDIRRLPAGAALTQNQWVYISAGSSDGRTAGQAYPADATNSLRCGVLGLNVTAHAAGDTAQVVTAGLATGFTGLVVGAVYYLDPSNVGSMTASKPTVSGQNVVALGVALSASTLLINPAAGASAQALSNDLEVKGNLTVDGATTLAGLLQGPTVNNRTQAIQVASSITSPSGYGASIAFPYINTAVATATTSMTSPTFISGAGFKRNVALGGYASSNYGGGAVSLLANYSGADYTRRSAQSHGGSVIGIAVSFAGGTLSTSVATAVTIVKNNTTTLISTNLTAAANGLSAFIKFNKGQYTFSDGDTLSGTVNFSKSGINVSVQCDITVESDA